VSDEHKTVYCHQNFMISLHIPFTSNGVLTGSVTEGAGDPFGPVVNPKGGGIRNPREASVSLAY